MATIKAIEAKSVHQIQSGQVIVDLCSVVKELVENSLDAGATTLEVRFKNYGLDSIEVQDNGSGINPSNYASVALKHYTSKLSSYDDLSKLQTFGFRGEALSSLCALSTFSITTAMATEAPKGTKLEFDMMGGLKSTTTVASGKGTAASVEQLFGTLPVRRRELTKNIKREYGKVVGLLHAYACIGTNVKFTFKNAIPKGKSMVVFSTKGNDTTRENIANIYGAKTLQALVTLDLQLTFQPSATQLAQDPQSNSLVVKGHISRPVFGEGRQTPDRQMFFVNGRPCGLPQIAKAINEVYKSFNVSQSPFIFADFVMDTNAYDVNVSPDKRTILLHNAAALIESLKESLTDLFDKHEQTVPQSQFQTPKLPVFKQLSVQRPAATTPDSEASSASNSAKRRRLTNEESSADEVDDESEEIAPPKMAFAPHFRNQASTREEVDPERLAKRQARAEKDQEKRAQKATAVLEEQRRRSNGIDEYDDVHEVEAAEFEKERSDPQSEHESDASPNGFDNADKSPPGNDNNFGAAPVIAREPPISAQSPVRKTNSPGVVQNAFDRMRPIRLPTQLATIEVDGETSTEILGTQPPPIVQKAFRTTSGQQKSRSSRKDISSINNTTLTQFSQRLRRFGAKANESNKSASEVDSEEDSEVVEEPHTGESGDSHEQSEQEEDEEEEPEQDVDDAPSEGRADGNDEEANGSDPEYADEDDEKAEEDARVAELIRAAEETTSKVNNQRITKALKGQLSRDSTTSLVAAVDVSLEKIKQQMRDLRASDTFCEEDRENDTQKSEKDTTADEEVRLALTVSKTDFGKMRIVGQFNLGFILAVRPAAEEISGHKRDELFIIDQHASDEKFNFERLQAETTVGNQRMVRPVNLDLTAVEEEIVLENSPALEKNGFLVEVDTSGDQQIGRRCTLHTLPLSKEVVFDTRDLEELIHLLSESPMLGVDSAVPRPSRVRKMFAMRACRSSIMIGKTLSKKQMKTVVTNMGTIDKPWNCPHGRPTMRHLTSLDALRSWSEGDELVLDDTEPVKRNNQKRWENYLNEE